jgi:AraC-like DNA-binding protein
MIPKAYLYRRIVLAKLFIDEHFAENINLHDIANEAYFSRFHFIRLFKMAYARTPHQYLTWVRIERAKLLLQSNIPVSDVCYAVGFEEISSFTHLFKKFTKSTPAFYQQQQLRRKREMKTSPLKFIPGCFATQNGWKEIRNFQQE